MGGYGGTHSQDKVFITPRGKIFITVIGGNVEIDEETVPPGIEVEILDLDNLKADPEGEIACWSPDLMQYWLANHKYWGRCDPSCPCEMLMREHPNIMKTPGF